MECGCQPFIVSIDDGDPAGVVELVDARHSKCRSARSVGSIPTARTSQTSGLVPAMAFSAYARKVKGLRA